MTDYTAIGNAIKTTLKADPWLGDAANVKTIETHKRGFSIQEEKDKLFLGVDELPALVIVPSAQPKSQNQTTTNEIEETIKSQIISITRNRDAQAGMDLHFALVNRVEKLLEKQKSSADDLGIDAFVRNVSTTDEHTKKGDVYYFISETSADIELTATF